jgi:hypothetical protein
MIQGAIGSFVVGLFEDVSITPVVGEGGDDAGVPFSVTVDPVPVESVVDDSDVDDSIGLVTGVESVGQ